MAIYLTTFIISCILLFQSQHSKKKWNIWAILGILIPCFIASFRSTHVGTDTGMYKYIYDNCKDLSIKVFFSQNVLNVESFYYFSSIIGKNITGFSSLLFIYEFLNVYFLYDVTYKLRNHISIWLVFFLFYMMLFSYSLNIMRQITSVMYVLWLSGFLISKHNLKYIFGCLIGISFHSTIILGGLLIWLVYKVYVSEGKKQKIYMISSIVGCIFFYFTLNQIGNILSLFNGSEVAKYSGYLDDNTSYIGKTDLCVRLIFLLTVIISFTNKIINKSLFKALFVLLFFELCLILCGVTSTVIFRLALYVTAFDIVVIPYILHSKRFKKSTSVLLNIVLICFSLTYWLYTVYLNGTNEIFPYTIQ
ncbi:MAG: EpsG family protein [Muribaculaceae bacterium]|nr:EpsG family protein [Muribaculaceae bacterium]